MGAKDKGLQVYPVFRSGIPFEPLHDWERVNSASKGVIPKEGCIILPVESYNAVPSLGLVTRVQFSPILFRLGSFKCVRDACSTVQGPLQYEIIYKS